MQLFNTKTRKKEEFKPLKQECVKIYYCGPTVYNHAHIWNLRAYIFEDVVVKTLKFLWYKVATTMNITDIDDKTIRDSQAAGEDLIEFTEKYTKSFLEDLEKLNIEKADKIIPVSTLIPEMVRMIQTMINRKNAYMADDGSVYFDIKSYKKYGKLANLDMKGMKTSVRIDNDEYDKENAADFVLWKSWKEADWDNFWMWEFIIDGDKVTLKGRPGWHIECSACNMKHFGAQIDIHMWGIDNLFPHHQNEVAQTESCTRKEFSKYWLHCNHLMVDGKKMSKSAWNFYRLVDIEDKYPDVSNDLIHRAMRLIYINGRYRDSIDFSFSKIEQALNTIKKIDETLKNLARTINAGNKKVVGISKDFRNEMQIIVSEYMQRLEDDINIPEALAEFHWFIKFTNTGIADATFSLEEEMSLMDMFETFNQVLWIIDFWVVKIDEQFLDEIMNLLDDRNKAKLDKNFERADTIRDELLEKGYKIIDGREGSILEKV